MVEHGSFISAARALRLPKTTVSRKVQDLETRLGAQLLHRTTRKLGLTEAGNVYFEHCQRIARELDEAESAVGQLQGGPRGWLRITAPYSLGITWIAPLLGEFHARHPEVRVEMVLTNEPLDLIDKEIDVALRVGNLPDSNLVARRLAVFRTQVYASPSYLERHGEPLHPDDLQHHRTLGMQTSTRRNGNGYFWPLNDGTSVTDYRIDPVLVANDPAALHARVAVRRGPDARRRRDGQAVRRARLRAARARRLDRAGVRTQRGVPARARASRRRCARSSISWSSASTSTRTTWKGCARTGSAMKWRSPQLHSKRTAAPNRPDSSHAVIAEVEGSLDEDAAAA